MTSFIVKARSPDLAPCDFFLWGFLKERIYKKKPKTIDELKIRIIEEIDNIPQTMLVRVMKNFRERLEECFNNEGRHLNDTTFKS